MKKKAPKHGEPYQDAEVALLYLVEPSDEARRLLAGLLGRTEDAIDFVWRWIDGARFPEEAYGRIRRQVATVENLLGPKRRGSVKFP